MHLSPFWDSIELARDRRRCTHFDSATQLVEANAMEGDLFRTLEALSRANVRYLVVGGVAVVLHGYGRMTVDLDLVLDLEEANALVAMDVFDRLGFRARAPVAVAAFADRTTRRGWIEDKGLTVFSLWNPAMPMTEVDLFVEEPFVFTEAYSRATQVVIGGVSIPVVGIDDLIALKQEAGRDKDLVDIKALQQIKRARGEQ